MSKEELLQRMSDCVFDMEEEEIIDVARNYLDAGFDPQEGILEGLVDGMRRASEMYEKEEYFVPELINCSDAMYAGMDVLAAALPDTGSHIGKAVIGVVEGDTHDIGKSLVKVMIETAGVKVADLGCDVPIESFVDYVRDHEDVDLLCMSSLMTTTMGGMATVIKRLEEEGLRDRVKIMIGGALISSGFAKSIGADLYTANAIEASNGAVKLIESVRYEAHHDEQTRSSAGHPRRRRRRSYSRDHEYREPFGGTLWLRYAHDHDQLRKIHRMCDGDARTAGL